MKIGLLSDTHGWLDSKILDFFKDCDEVWHCGDIGDLAVTDRLAANFNLHSQRIDLRRVCRLLGRT